MTPQASSSAQTSASTSMSFSPSPSSNSGSSYWPISIDPIFLMPNTSFNSFPDEEVDCVGWESFPPLVESLEDEEGGEKEPSLARYHGSSSKHTMPKKSVSFSTVNIREHQVIVGDHPYTSDSLPLSLGWAHAEEPRVVDIDTYEIIRSSHRRCQSDMQLTFLERKTILKLVGGLSERDIMHEQRRAFRESYDDPSTQRMRRVQTVAAMQTQAQPAQQSKAPSYLPPAVAHALSINPGCPINVEPRASAITA